MRFRQTVDGWSSVDQERLLNGLTLGWGWVAHAARLALADAECGPILAALTAALGSFTGAAALLGDQAAPTAQDGTAGSLAGAGQRDLSWRDLLATRMPAEAAVLTADLEALAHQTRELGQAVQANDGTDHIRRHLAATIDALSDLRRRLTAAVEG